ncbi:MAG: CBS domain-containing protein [Candidatus Bathyarchaeota archaeon]|nr:CBS domain-containing protein [Candidatus Bathyarchaeota archaeon]
MQKLKVRELMLENVVTTKEDTTIEDAIETLFRKHVGALMITDDERKCKGIFTERDALRSVVRKVPLNTHLRRVMSKNVITVRENASFAEAKRLMTSHRIRHLPVIDKKGYLVGMLTLRRILDELVGMPTVKS